jgi:hypothetical protein
MAEASYNQAISLASSHPQDLEVLTKSQAGLAAIKIVLGEEYQAGKLAQQAQDGYGLLGMSATAQELDQSLMALVTGESLDNNTLVGQTRGGSSENPIEDVIVPNACYPIVGCFPY